MNGQDCGHIFSGRTTQALNLTDTLKETCGLKNLELLLWLELTDVRQIIATFTRTIQCIH